VTPSLVQVKNHTRLPGFKNEKGITDPFKGHRPI
jgi:hypothetical protein